jgi:hypothetical protein
MFVQSLVWAFTARDGAALVGAVGRTLKDLERTKHQLKEGMYQCSFGLLCAQMAALGITPDQRAVALQERSRSLQLGQSLDPAEQSLLEQPVFAALPSSTTEASHAPGSSPARPPWLAACGAHSSLLLLRACCAPLSLAQRRWRASFRQAP